MRKVINHSKIICNLLITRALQKSPLVSALINYLNLTNIHLIKADINDIYISPDIKHNIYILTAGFEAINVERNKKGDSQCNNIVLLFDNSEKTELLNVNHIDFRKEKDFYHAVLHLLKTIVDNSNIDEIMNGFKNESQSLQEA